MSRTFLTSRPVADLPASSVAPSAPADTEGFQEELAIASRSTSEDQRPTDNVQEEPPSADPIEGQPVADAREQEPPEDDTAPATLHAGISPDAVQPTEVATTFTFDVDAAVPTEAPSLVDTGLGSELQEARDPLEQIIEEPPPEFLPPTTEAEEDAPLETPVSLPIDPQATNSDDPQATSSDDPQATSSDDPSANLVTTTSELHEEEAELPQLGSTEGDLLTSSPAEVTSEDVAPPVNEPALSAPATSPEEAASVAEVPPSAPIATTESRSKFQESKPGEEASSDTEEAHLPATADIATKVVAPIDEAPLPVSPEPDAAKPDHRGSPSLDAMPLGSSTDKPSEPLATETARSSSEASRSIDSGRFVHRVSRAFAAAEQRGGGPIEMRLSPPELGSLQVRLEVKEGILTASMEVETQAARNVLLDNLPALRDRLAEQQIRVEKFDVDVRDDSQQTEQQGAEERQQRQRTPTDEQEPERTAPAVVRPTVHESPVTNRSSLDLPNDRINFVA